MVYDPKKPLPKLDGPFAAGQSATGHITHPGYEHLKFEVQVERIEPEGHFSFRWHPYAIDPALDYSSEPPTLVEFRLEETADGTRLTVAESGFDRIPAHRRDEAFRMDSQGWSAQMGNRLLKAFKAARFGQRRDIQRCQVVNLAAVIELIECDVLKFLIGRPGPV